MDRPIVPISAAVKVVVNLKGKPEEAVEQILNELGVVQK
jgi:adenylate kinase